MAKRESMALAAIVAALASAGCGSAHGPSSADKAGGASTATVLRLASFDYLDQPNAPLLRAFAARVASLSHGRLKVQLVFDVGWPAADQEQRIARAVRSGRYDLGWIAARGWDELGVRSFQALQAPFLITDYSLMNAVANSSLAGRMLAGLRGAGVTGLALVPDALRHPAAQNTPLVSLHDFAGSRIQVEPSHATDALVVALGAMPIHGPNLFVRHDGELNPFNNMGVTMTSVTGNVALDTRLNTLFGNPDALDGLDRKQLAALRQAAHALVAQAERGTPSERLAAIRRCRKSGVAIVTAGGSDLAALVRAARPVTAALERDTQTKAFIEEIAKLKARMPPTRAPVIPSSCRTTKRRVAVGGKPRSASFLNGTYHIRFTRADALAFGDPPAQPASLANLPSVDIRILRDGKWWTPNARPKLFATYTVTNNRLTVSMPEYHSIETFTFTRDSQGTLRLTPVLPMDPGDQWVLAGEPWYRVGPPVNVR